MVLQRFSSASSRWGSSFRNLTASTSTLSTTRILLCRLGNWSARWTNGDVRSRRWTRWTTACGGVEDRSSSDTLAEYIRAVWDESLNINTPGAKEMTIDFMRSITASFCRINNQLVEQEKKYVGTVTDDELDSLYMFMQRIFKAFVKPGTGSSQVKSMQENLID